MAVSNYNDTKLLADLSKDLDEAIVGINEQEIELLMTERGLLNYVHIYAQE